MKEPPKKKQAVPREALPKAVENPLRGFSTVFRSLLRA